MTTPKEIYPKAREITDKIRDIVDDLNLDSHGWVIKHGNKSSIDLYKEVLTAYGLACVKAALKEAAKITENHVAVGQIPAKIISAEIRAINPQTIMETEYGKS